MAQARVEQQWNHTASLLAMLVNVNRDSRKGFWARPMDFHPSFQKQPEVLPRTDIRLLKTIFVDQRCE